ncbi:MFS transporter [Streptomyces sp. NPDC058284]|uniref:MFS transporter n=1 Tax=unclassified Streptomyces TaxID=2593676 RepID=UPI003657F3F5
MPLLNKLGTAASRPIDHDLRRLRIALTVFFALDGFVFAGWVVRIPAIKQQTGASAGELGLALLAVSAGAVVTMTLTGHLCRRYGSIPMTVACGVALPLSVALPPLTGSVLVLGLVLLFFGAAYGGISVAMNSAAVDLVRALQRPVMPSFHAAFSLGGMLGSGLGGLVAGHLSPTRHLLGITVVGLAITAAAAPALLRYGTPDRLRKADDAPARDQAAAPVEPAGGARRMDRRTRGLVMVFGFIALCTAYGEGAIADWGPLHLEDDLHAHPGVAAAGYACFAFAMTIGRLSGTALLERLGRTRTVVAGGATACAGMLLGALAPSTGLALAGFAVTGLGLANIFPVAVERAGALAGPGGVAAASTLGYGGMLIGPPLIGFMADWYSLPTALTSVALLAAVASVIGFATRHTERTERTERMERAKAPETARAAERGERTTPTETV